MKKAIIVLLTIFLLASLSACTGREPNNPITTGDPQAMLPTENGELPTEAPTPVPTEAPTEEPTSEPTARPITVSLLSEGNGGFGNFDGFENAREREWWNGKLLYEKADERITVYFDGKQYSGEYQYSRYRLFDSFITHVYSVGNGMDFKINANTGELITLTLLLNNEENLPDLDDPDEETLIIARSYAAMLVDNIEEYGEPEVMKENFVGYDIYAYSFNHRIGGIKTNDYVNIFVTAKGHLSGFNIGDRESYPVIEAGGERFEGYDIEGAITEELQSCVPEDYTIIEDPVFSTIEYALTPDNEVVICVEAYIRAKQNENEDSSPYGGLFGGIFVIH